MEASLGGDSGGQCREHGSQDGDRGSPVAIMEAWAELMEIKKTRPARMESTHAGRLFLCASIGPRLWSWVLFLCTIAAYHARDSGRKKEIASRGFITMTDYCMKVCVN